jgi:hypothetical protein
MVVVPATSLVDWPVAPLFLCEVLGVAEAVEIGGHAGVLTLPARNPEAVDAGTYDCAICPPDSYILSPLAKAYPCVHWGYHVSWPRLLAQVRTLVLRMDFECQGDCDLPNGINAVQDAFEGWFGLLCDWLGVLTKQDLYESEPRSPGKAPGERFPGWFCLREGEWRRAQGRQTIKVRPPEFDKAISAANWARGVAFANRGQRAPAEHILLRDARESLARDDPRRSVLNAGLAGELSLGVAVREELARQGGSPSRVDRSLDRLTLGQLVASIRTFMPGVWLPPGISATLVKKRNEAAHGSRDISVADARAALDVADSLVSRYVRLAYSNAACRDI